MAKGKGTEYCEKQKRSKSNLSKAKGQKVAWHTLAHAVAAPLLNVIYLSLLLISFATSAMLCTVRKVILEFLTCVDMYRPPLCSPSLPLSPPPFIFPSLSLSQLSALAEGHTDACRSASDRCSSSQAKRRKGTRVKTDRDRKRKMEKGRGGWVGGERAKKRGRRRGMSDTIENWPSPLCEKGTRCRTRPRPIITARWAVEGCGQRARLKNKIAWDIFRVGLQNNFILTFPFTALCTVRTQSEQLPTQPCG